MSGFTSPKIQNRKYTKALVYNIMEHLHDDDYFYHKKINWEDWVIMRMDVQSVFSPKKNSCITKETINTILNKLNGGNHDL